MTTTTYEFNAGDGAPFNELATTLVDRELCYVCGRKLGANPLYFEVINGGDLRLQDGTEYDIASDRGYMGCYPVGSTCAHKFAPGLLFKMNRKAK
jgi:hypothetical protein